MSELINFLPHPECNETFKYSLKNNFYNKKRLFNNEKNTKKLKHLTKKVMRMCHQDILLGLKWSHHICTRPKFEDGPSSAHPTIS